MEPFDHQRIEQQAQEKWASLNMYETDLTQSEKKPYYLLVEFPYPSGDLHTGHWYAFAIPDIYARLLRMRGKNVLFPIGFDAFGLPAENAAIKHGVDPKEWTYKNIERMHTQIKSMGASFDWSKEVIACDPEYYQWTQWLFTQLFEHNLAEHKEAAVKWCPNDQTVLANEQVIDGKCDRCGHEVEEKMLTQWFLKITEYAERLLTDLEELPWREEIKDAQRAWIGKSEGAAISFPINKLDTNVEVFTTRPDTIFGATYIVLAPEHPLVATLAPHATNTTAIETYIAATAQKTERERSENKEKTGVVLEGVTATNPATKEEIPIYIADYVLASYGTGAVMAVPAHDERDYAFAQKFNLPIRPVITSPGETDEVYTGDGVLVHSGAFDGKNNREATADIIAVVGGKATTNYRLRDWLVSRQRYWGCPIPIVYDPEGKPHAIPKEHLPWMLPTDVDFKPTGESPLASSKELRERVERIFGEGWTPEFDTLDTFVDSSWYFMRYLAAHNNEHFSDETLMKNWLPVNRYSGGSEHTTMHVLYARFFTKALYDLSLVPVKEPFAERFNRGLIMGPDGQKMSKSKGNIINPDNFVNEYGADAVRLYLAFIGPYNEPGNYPWSLNGVAAMRKFLDRVGRIVARAEDGASTSQTLKDALATANLKIAADADRFKFNTAVAALMVLTNTFEKEKGISPDAAKEFVLLLAPFAPFLAEHLWERLGEEGSVHVQDWPAAVEPEHTEVEVVVQVNGKRKGSVTLVKDASEEAARTAAQKLPGVVETLKKGEVTRVVYVPNRIINLVS